MDTGDEAAQEAYRQMKEATDGLIRWLLQAAQGAARGANRLSSRTRSIRETVDEAVSSREAEAAIKGGSADAVPYSTAYAAGDGELEELLRYLDGNAIEHYADPASIPSEHPGSREEYDAIKAESGPAASVGGVYAVYIPDREPYSAIAVPFTDREIPVTKSPAGFTLLRDAAPELSDALSGAFSKQEAVSRAASMRACMAGVPSGAGPSAAIDADAVVLGAAGNLALEHRTVRWDAEGKLLKDRLDALGIPFAARSAGDGLVTIEVSKGNAGPVKGLIDALCESIKGFDQSRIANYSELAAAADGTAPGEGSRILSSEVSRAQAPFVKEYLAGCGIGYTSISDDAAGIERLYVEAADVASHSSELEKAMESGLTEEQVRAAMERAERILPKAADREDIAKGRVKHMEPSGRSAERADRPRTISEDEREAQRALDAMSREQGPIEKQRTKARG